MADPTTEPRDQDRRSYARRWFGHAADETWRIFREHLALTALGLIGTALALYFLAPFVLGPDSSRIVTEELLLAALAALGSILVVLLALFVWSFFAAPAALERQTRSAHTEREAVLRNERDTARRERDELAERIDRARLRLQVINDSDPLPAVASSNAVMADFIKGRKSDRIGIVAFAGET